MPVSRLRKPKLRPVVREPINRTDKFLMRTTYTYLYRHLAAFPSIKLNPDFFGLLPFLSNNLEGIINISLQHCSQAQQGRYQTILGDCFEIHGGYEDSLPAVLDRAPKALRRRLCQTLELAIQHEIQGLSYQGQSDLEASLNRIKTMFAMTEPELQFSLFLYLTDFNDGLGDYFYDSLKAHKLIGRPYLGNALGLTRKQLDQALKGTVRKIGLIDDDSDMFELNHDFLPLFEGEEKTRGSDKFFEKIISAAPIPLNHHLGVQQAIPHLLGLLKAKPVSSTHVLLYGPPGTGKSSLAEGLIHALNLPAYKIATPKDSSQAGTRRAGILACLNMTEARSGGLILIDEADHILNTNGHDWPFRRAGMDKAWLNQVLEIPKAKMIWIVNEIEEIEPAVLRRFAYSLRFKPFNKRQRMIVWENILRKYKAKRYFSSGDIAEFAGMYKLSPGGIEMAVRKAVEANSGSKQACQDAVKQALEAHEALITYGEPGKNRVRLEAKYSPVGLKIEGDLEGILGQLEAFDAVLSAPESSPVRNLNLLFYGPPGTGKSELTKYIGQRLGREVILKTISELQSPFLGVGEKNVREAFEQAEREEAVLVIDEADSLLFSRARAVRSWEVSFTNEFLTRMEGFRGILICTTNRLKDLDPASIRRFQHKLKFDYLDGAGNLIFYQRLLEQLVAQPLDLAGKAVLMQITALTPGDFKTVRDRHALLPGPGLTHQQLLQGLRQEAAIKAGFEKTARIGF